VTLPPQAHPRVGTEHIVLGGLATDREIAEALA
jgi:hypothetical protein